MMLAPIRYEQPPRAVAHEKVERPPEREDDEADSVLDLRRVGEKFRYALHSFGRNPRLAAAIFLVVLGGAITSLWALPKTYHAEAKLLTQRSPALQVRADSPSGDPLTRAATETVLSRASLTTLIERTNLLQHWEDHRAPAIRLKDRIVRAIARHETDEDRIDDMVERLQKKLTVWTNPEGTVSIAIDWPDAEMAKKLLDVAEETYLETRYQQEITAIGESLAILQGHSTDVRAEVDEAVATIQKLRENKDPSVKAQKAKDGGDADKDKDGEKAKDKPPPKPRPRPPMVEGPSPELKAQIAAKQQALDAMEEARHRKLSEIEARLADLKGTLTPKHPAVVDLERSAAAISAESPEATQLRSELSSLRARSSRAQEEADADAAAHGEPMLPRVPSSLHIPADVLRLETQLGEDRDPVMMAARASLRDAMDKFGTLERQVQSARIDLETARVAFKYRYNVVQPAQLPRRPKSPNVPIFMIAAFLAALFAAGLAAVIADIRSGKVLERWQLERILGRPLLGEAAMPALTTELEE